MKTRIENTESRNNQLSRVLTHAAAVLVSVVLLSFTVNAQDLFKELLSHTSYGKMALVMSDESNTNETSELPATTYTAAFAVETKTDAPMAIENWMTNDEYFGSANVFNQVAQEEALEVENWMSSDNYFGSTDIFNQVEQDETLEVESWMTNENYFGSTAVFNQVAQDETLEVENWMTDENFYNGRFTQEQEEELPLEAWMCDASYYNY